MLFEYQLIAIFFLISALLSLIVFFLSFFLINEEKDIEKLSSYECGFNPFEEARNKFDVRFYLVGILFLIFDLEIIYLFPWVKVIVLSRSFWVMIIFLIILLIGFIYEWQKNALEWS